TCGAPSAPAVARWPTRCRSRNACASGLQSAIADLLAGELCLRLLLDLAVAALVARREVEHLEPLHARGAGGRARLPGGQVMALGRLVHVRLEEGGLA